MKIKILFGFVFNLLAILGFCWLLFHSTLSIYLLKMAKGQLTLILNTEKIEEVLKENKLSKAEKEKLLLVEKIKKYSVDSLGYKSTKNFTTYFDQKNQPVLWVVTACKPFKFEDYEWEFPLLGKVSYKGFFAENLAQAEYLKLLRAGYDADISNVSAWSTLGWLSDPVLSSMLRRSKSRLANLLFHELFHATYYARSTVAVNENLANFVANKATLKFLRNDTAELRRYVQGIQDDSLYNRFIFAGYERLNNFYERSKDLDTASLLKGKQKLLMEIYFQAGTLKLNNIRRYESYNKEILLTKNAFFMGARRYDGLYDSLNRVLSDKYHGNLKSMILDLKK